jgi:hypothetical protein
MIGIGIPFDQDCIKVPSLVSAIIEDVDHANVVLTFNQSLTGSPATTDFTIAGKTVINVDVLGFAVIVTVSVDFVIGNTPTIVYTQPVLNPLTGVGGKVASFSQLIDNHIT